MRTTDERIHAVEQRVKTMKHQKRQRRYGLIGLSALAACLVVIVGLGFAMPGIMRGLSDEHYTHNDLVASIFFEGNAHGYIMIGLIAFTLGVCLTVLCFLLQRRSQRDRGT